MNTLSIENSFIFSIGLIIVVCTIFSNIVLTPILDSYEFRSSYIVSISFLIICIATLASQFILIFYINKKQFSKIHLKTKFFMYSNLLLLISSAFMTIILSLVIKDIFVDNTYDLFLFKFVVIYSIIVAICIQIIVIIKFLQWVIRKRNIILLLYTTSHFSLFITLLVIFLLIYAKIDINSLQISSSLDPWNKTIIIDSTLSQVYRIFLLLTFILIWIATSILLKTYSTNYMKKIGKAKFWILVSLPLIYYIFSSDFVTNSIYKLILFYNLNDIFPYLLSITKPMGGVFFALPFLFMAKNISNVHIKFYLLICAIGIMILISSLEFLFFYLYPYPPFGLSTITNLPLSIYLLLVGMVFSARSISYDKKLLLELSSRIKNEPSSFLNGIGSIEWQNNIQKTVKQIGIKNLEEPTPDSSLTKDEIHDYIIKVLNEITKDNNNLAKKDGKSNK